MIKIGFDSYLIIHNLVCITVLVALWARTIWRENRESWNVSQEQVCHCKICNVTFLSKRVGSVSACPTCREPVRIRAKKTSKRIRYE